MPSSHRALHAPSRPRLPWQMRWGFRLPSPPVTCARCILVLPRASPTRGCVSGSGRIFLCARRRVFPRLASRCDRTSASDRGDLSRTDDRCCHPRRCAQCLLRGLRPNAAARGRADPYRQHWNHRVGLHARRQRRHGVWRLARHNDVAHLYSSWFSGPSSSISESSLSGRHLDS